MPPQSPRSADAPPLPAAPLRTLAQLAPEQRQQHLRVIESIAAETRRSMEEVAPLYDEVLDALLRTARVADYLAVFAYRRVRTVLMHEL